MNRKLIWIAIGSALIAAGSPLTAALGAPPVYRASAALTPCPEAYARLSSGRSLHAFHPLRGGEFPPELELDGVQYKPFGRGTPSPEELEQLKADAFGTQAYHLIARDLGLPLQVRRHVIVRNTKGEVRSYYQDGAFSSDYVREGLSPDEIRSTKLGALLAQLFEDSEFGRSSELKRHEGGASTLVVPRVSPALAKLRAEDRGFLGQLPGIGRVTPEKSGPEFEAARDLAGRIRPETLASLEREASALGLPPGTAGAIRARITALREAVAREEAAVRGIPHHPLPRDVREIPPRADEIIPWLADRFPELGPLFNRNAGVTEGYSVGEHTARVLRGFERQLPFFEKELGSLRLGVGQERLLPLLRATLALHDIGKSEAIRAGSKTLQHHYTVPHLDRVLEKLGFKPEEVALARALVDNDILGEYMKGELTRDQARRALGALARGLRLDPADFTRLQSRFYMMDTQSYPYLRQGLYEELPSGEVVSRDPRFTSLLHPARPPSPAALRSQREAMLADHARNFEALFTREQGDYPAFVARIENAAAARVEGARLPARGDPMTLTRMRQLKDEDVEIRIHTRPDALASILESGYLNRAEGGRGSIQAGLHNGQVTAESSLLGTTPGKFHEIPAENRPHFGLLGPRLKPGEKQDISALNLPPGYRDPYNTLQESYGPVALVLDPRDYREALTLYPGDSVNSLQSQQKAMTPEGIRWRKVENWGQTYVPWKYRMSLAPLLDGSQDTWAPRAMHLPEGYRYPETREGLGTGIEYIEAQIWAPVRKISAIEVFKRQVTPEQLEKIRETARRHGIPVRVTDGLWGVELLP